LIGNLWKHVGPSSKKILRVGLNSNVEDAIAVVRNHIDEVVVRYQISASLERRFEWLAAGDTHVKLELWKAALDDARHALRSDIAKIVREGTRP
jgi:hypothetical protein